MSGSRSHHLDSSLTPPQVDAQAAYELMLMAYKAGVTLFDNAEAYASGSCGEGCRRGGGEGGGGVGGRELLQKQCWLP